MRLREEVLARVRGRLRQRGDAGAGEARLDERAVAGGAVRVREMLGGLMRMALEATRGDRRFDLHARRIRLRVTRPAVQLGRAACGDAFGVDGVLEAEVAEPRRRPGPVHEHGARAVVARGAAPGLGEVLARVAGRDTGVAADADGEQPRVALVREREVPRGDE